MFRQIISTVIQTAIRKAEEKKQAEQVQINAALQQLLAKAEVGPYRGTNIGFGCVLKK